MKFNVMKAVALAQMGFDIFNRIKNSNDKADASIDAAELYLPAVEAIVGKDLVNDARVRPFADRYVRATRDLLRVVDEVKALKPSPSE